MMEIYFNEVPTDDFEKYFILEDKIAYGSFGKVIKAYDLKNNKEVAVKILNKDIDSKNLNGIILEINIFQQLNHKNIVKFNGHIETASKLYIIMDLLRGGTLKSLIDNRKANGKKLTEEECSVIMKNLFEAVKYLHEKDVVHRDIKPDNIMFEDSEDLKSLKLIDFGLSARYETHSYLSDICGTLIYMAPEQAEKKAYSKPIDMWSCGMVMYYLLNDGNHPIYEPGMTSKEFLIKLKNPVFTTKNKISKMAHSLLFKLLEINYTKRFTIEKALNHPWITRDIYQNIPETYFEDWRISSIKRKFKQV